MNIEALFLQQLEVRGTLDDQMRSLHDRVFFFHTELSLVNEHAPTVSPKGNELFKSWASGIFLSLAFNFAKKTFPLVNEFPGKGIAFAQLNVDTSIAVITLRNYK